MNSTHLNCFECPRCGTKMRTQDSRPHDAYGFSTVRRRKVCGSCGFRVSTVEVHAAVAHTLFAEDAE